MERTVDECFFHIQNGANIKQGIVDGGFPITRIETISNDRFNRDKMGFAGITDISKYESYVLEDGDLLMSHINSVQYLGRTVLYEKQGNETIIHGMNLLRLKARRDIITPAYARYVFYSQPFRTQIARITKKSVNQASFAVTDLKKIKIDVPTISEQMKVVDLLDRIKEIIDNRNSELSQFDNLIKARFVEMFGDVIHNDKSWDIYTFSDITESRLGKMLDSKKQTGQSPFPYLANANVQWFRFDINNLNTMDFSEDDREEFALEDGDLMVCEGGEIGRCAVWHNQIQPCYFQKAIHRVRCNRDVILSDYLSWWFKYNCDHQGFADIEGAKATISHLPGAKMKKLQVVVPDIEIQKQFCEFVKQVDKSKAAVLKSLEETQMLFNSLMQKSFGG